MASDATVVLDHDDMRRTLVRIAHEIVEKNPGGTIALVGIHRRGAALAQRLHALASELLDTSVPLGFVDISFYRDDLSIRPSAPIVHASLLRPEPSVAVPLSPPAPADSSRKSSTDSPGSS